MGILYKNAVFTIFYFYLKMKSSKKPHFWGPHGLACTWLDAEKKICHKSVHASPWRPIFDRFWAIFIFSEKSKLFFLAKIFIFCPYSHSRGILGVFQHASGPSLMVYHKFTQTQHRPLSGLTTERFPWPCHVENHMYFVYITNIFMNFKNFPR